MRPFYLVLRDARERMGWSQDRLAKELGVSRVSVGNYERGAQVPSLETGVWLAKTLDFSLDGLIFTRCDRGGVRRKRQIEKLESRLARLKKQDEGK